MENTILVGLSRQVALRRELDVIANNIANIGTTGFKADGVKFEEYLAPGARIDTFPMGRDRRVSFVLDRETRTDMAQGAFQQTGNPLDVAIDGEGFFAVETPQGERYTRSGSFVVNAAGELVTPAGHRVLGNGGPIVLDPNDTEISIAQDGTISTREGERGRLRIVRFEEPSQVAKQGDNLFAAAGDAVPLPAEPRTRLVQGSVEKSNVHAMLEMSRMIEVTRAYTSLSQLLNRTDELRRTAIERLADVPA